jgi:hypothetical protein
MQLVMQLVMVDPSFFDGKRITEAVVVIGQGVLVIKWLYKRIRNGEIQAAFVEDMATNHLPHLYHADRKICEALQIELDEPPPIKFVKLNGNGKSKH